MKKLFLRCMNFQAMQAVDVPEYDFVKHQRSSKTHRVDAADVVIIEGILVLHMEAVRSMLNMKIFVDTDDDVRLARRCRHLLGHNVPREACMSDQQW